MFGIEADWEADKNAAGQGWLDGGQGKAPDIPLGGQGERGCPELTATIDIVPDLAAPLRPILAVDAEDTGRSPSPCSVRIDADVASSISRSVTSLATTPPTPTTTSSAQTALAAAAYLLFGLAF